MATKVTRVSSMALMVFIIFVAAAAASGSAAADAGYLGASMDELLADAPPAVASATAAAAATTRHRMAVKLHHKHRSRSALRSGPPKLAAKSAAAAASTAATEPDAPSTGEVTCPKTRHVRHCISGRILYLTTISYQGAGCRRRKKVQRTRVDRDCAIGTKYSQTKCTRAGWRVETSVTNFLDDCVCKTRKLNTKKRCTPECRKPSRKTRCIDNSLYRIENGEKVVNYACTAYTKQESLKPDCTVGVRRRRGVCRGLFMNVTELRTSYTDCRCRTRRRTIRQRCACPKTKVRTKCEANVKMRVSTVHRLSGNDCKTEVRAQRIPISCPKRRVKSRSSCRSDCSQTVTLKWTEVRNCRCVRPVRKRTVKCCCPKPQRSSYCRKNVLHSMVRRFQLREGKCKEKVKVTKKPIVCNKKFKPVKSSCAFNGYRRVTFYSQERRGCACAKRRRITYEKCGCGKDYKTEECEDNVWIVRAVTHKMDAAKSACKRSVRVKKKPTECRGKLHRRVSECQSDGYRVVKRMFEEARDCACVTRVVSQRERCRCDKSRTEQECRSNRIYRHRFVHHLVDGKCILRRTTSVVRIRCGANTVKQSGCVKGWRTKTYVSFYPYNCKCQKRVYNRQVRCACPKNRTKTRCIRGTIVQSEVKYEMKNGQCVGHSCQTTRRAHCARRFEVKRGKCVKNQRTVTLRETRRRGCACKSVVKRSREVCGCPRPVVKRVCSKDQVETVYSTKYKLTDGLCLAEEDEKVIPNKCPSSPLYRRGRCNSRGVRVDTWVHHSQRRCVCHETVKRAHLRCRCPKSTSQRQCVKHRSLEVKKISYSLIRGVCKRSVSFERTPVHCLEIESPIYGRCRGSGRKSSGSRLITYVKHQTRDCRCVKRTRVKKIPCDCHLLNYHDKVCQNGKRRYLLRQFRYNSGAKKCRKSVTTVKQPINCPKDKKLHKSPCGKLGYQTVTQSHNQLVNCACVKRHRKRRVVCRCPKTKVELKPDTKAKWNRKCTTRYTLNRAKNRCDKKTDCPMEIAGQKMCRPQMAPPRIGKCDHVSGFQKTVLSVGKPVLLPAPQNRYSCLVQKLTLRRRCACPKPAKSVKCRRNVLITVTVSQTLKGQKCIKTKKVDKKATECPKATVSETKCKTDNTKVVTKVSYAKSNCKCVKRVKNRRVLCRCPDPIISTRCVRHKTKERSTVSYKLKNERCHRKKQVSKTQIKCKNGTRVRKTNCNKSSCNQRITRTTRYTRDCECRKKVDIASVKCCCPKSVTRVKCLDDSRRVVKTTSYRLVSGACQRRVSRREKKIVCLSGTKPIRGPCKASGYRHVTFVSFALRRCKCVRVKRRSSELCRCPKSHRESSCQSEKIVIRVTRHKLQKAGSKTVCTRHVRSKVKTPDCPVGTHVKATKCREDDFKRITTTVKYQKNCKCRQKVKVQKKRCRCPKSFKKIACRGHNEIRVTRTAYRLHGNSCLKDVKTSATKVDCYETEKPDRSPCGDAGYRSVKLVSYYARDCKCARRVRVRRERCSCPKDYKARECINNNVVSTYVTYTLTPKECIRRSRITKERPKCAAFRKKSKGVCRSDGFQSVFFEREELVNCECVKKVKTQQVRCACPKPRVRRRCLDNQIATTRTTFKLSGGRCHKSKSHHRTRINCPARKRVVRHKCRGNRQIYEYIEHQLKRCACKEVRRRVVKPCRCPKPSTVEKPCVNGKQKVVTVYYIKDRLGNCKKMSDVDTEICAKRKNCRCDALGDPHFLMYDGVPLHFQGECKYTLTKLRNPADKCAFDVQVKNEHRGVNKNYTYVRLLDVRIFGRVFRLHQHKRVLIDGKITSLPYTGHGVRIFYSGPYVQFVASKCRFSAAFDGRYTGYVEVGKEYAGRMVGLCGNCNGKATDDYVTKDGVNVMARARHFERDNLVGNSFRVPDDSDSPGAKCRNLPAKSTASSACSNAWIPRSRSLCQRLINRRGPFGRCLAGGRVPALALFNDCRTDACANRRQPANMMRAVCEAHKDMAEQCAEAGFPGIRWRSKRFCLMKCDKDKLYTTKMRPCPRSCENLFFGTKSNCYHLPSREGCACRKGLVMDGRKCVKPAMCQCVKKFPELMCKDDAPAEQCKKWRSAGHCASNPYTMLKMCRETCQLCHTKKPRIACRNVMSLRRCLLLKRKGQCGTSFVSTACSRTCGLCSPRAKVMKSSRSASSGKKRKTSSRGHTVVLRS